ncbi:MAG: cytochrome C [Desulfuromonadaceae bacterium]|nr:cytochrome C [Desulfuromonadaceae bacterium]
MKLTAGVLFGMFFCAVCSTQATELNADLGNVRGGNYKRAQAILNKKCTSCHSKDKIDVALSSGKDMKTIQKDMEKRGARLTSNERDVLGIFWKESQPVSRK